jgi:hypothetical protein
VDRDGCKKRLPFLRASAALLHLPAMKRDFCSIETLSHFMARIKKAAKNSPAGFCLGIMGTLEISDDGISEELLAALAQTRTAVYIAEPPDVFPRRLAPWTPSVASWRKYPNTPPRQSPAGGHSPPAACLKGRL